MNNTVALLLGLTLVGLLILDWQMFDSAYIIIWGRLLLNLIEWMAFWR